MRKAATLLALALVLGFLPATTQASAIAVTRLDTTATGNRLTDGFTNGWEFSPTVDILVGSLGVFDADGDGLAHHHDVKLWDLAGSELAGVALSAGTHTLTSGYAFVDIAGVTLAAGETYVISTFVTGAPGERFLADGILVAAPEISVETDVRRWAAGNFFPASTHSVNAVPLGPNFTFDTVAALETTSSPAIPEPATLSLLLLGLLALVRLRAGDNHRR